MKREPAILCADRRRMGHLLKFDPNVVLQRAMHLFWRHGYQTSSIADLAAAMGITLPGLCTAWSDRKRLLLEVVDLYAGDGNARAGRSADTYEESHWTVDRGASGREVESPVPFLIGRPVTALISAEGDADLRTFRPHVL